MKFYQYEAGPHASLRQASASFELQSRRKVEQAREGGGKRGTGFRVQWDVSEIYSTVSNVDVDVDVDE